MKVAVLDARGTFSNCNDMDLCIVSLGNQVFEKAGGLGAEHVFIYLEADNEVHLNFVDLLRNSRNPKLNPISMYAVYEYAALKACGQKLHPHFEHISSNCMDPQALQHFLELRGDTVFFNKL